MATDKYVTKDTSEPIGPKGSEIPIMANSMVIDIQKLVMPDGNAANYSPLEKAMDEFKECGFNGFIAKINYEYRENLLKGVLARAESKGLFVIVFGSAFDTPSQEEINKLNAEAEKLNDDTDKYNVYINAYNNKVYNFLEACESYQSFGGVHLNDEPTSLQLQDKYPTNSGPTISDFNTVNGSYYCLSNRYKIIQENMSKFTSMAANAILMVNLVGVQDSDTHIEEGNYSSYLDAYYHIEGSNSNSYPYLWSFDIYPITEHNYLLERNFYLVTDNENVDSVKLSQNGEVEVNYNFFYDDLKLFNEYATRSDGIFWSYVQGMSYMGARFFHPLSQEKYLRFAVFSSLAMGAQGIICWTYHQRSNEPTELYLSAPLDRQDRKTPVWYYAKKVIAEVRRFNDVFRGSKLIDYGHMVKLYDTEQNLKFPFGRLTGIRPFGDGYLVTRLRQETNTEYIVIVNHSVCDYQEITLFFSSGTTILEMTPEGKTDGESQAITVSSSGVNRILPPGGYLIYQYTV